MSDLTQEDIDELEAQAKWWQELGNRVGWQLMGFTFRSAATFIVAGETIHLNGQQRDAMMAALDTQTTNMAKQLENVITYCDERIQSGDPDPGWKSVRGLAMGAIR